MENCPSQSQSIWDQHCDLKFHSHWNIRQRAIHQSWYNQWITRILSYHATAPAPPLQPPSWAAPAPVSPPQFSTWAVPAPGLPPQFPSWGALSPDPSAGFPPSSPSAAFGALQRATVCPNSLQLLHWTLLQSLGKGQSREKCPLKIIS